MLLAVLGIGLLSSLVVVLLRVKAEADFRQVELALDYSSWKTLWETAGIPQDQALRELKQSGAVSVVLREETLDTLSQDGKVTLFTKEDIDNAHRHDAEAYAEALSFMPAAVFGPPQTFAFFSDADLARQAYAVLSFKLFGSAPVQSTKQGVPKLYLHPLTSDAVLAVPGRSLGSSSRTFSPKKGKFLSWGIEPREIGLGFSREKWTAAQQAALSVIVNLSSYPTVSSSSVDYTFAHFPDKPSLVIFSGEQVLGAGVCLEQTAAALQQTELPFSFLEFTDPLGKKELLGYAGMGSLASVSHTIPPLEMEGMSWDKAGARFFRAVLERNIRVLVVQPLWDINGNLWQSNVSGLAQLRASLQNAGYGCATPASRLHFNKYPFMLLCGLGILAFVLLLLLKVLLLKPATPLLGWGAGVVALAWCVSCLSGLLLSTTALLLALLSCIAFSSYSVFFAFGPGSSTAQSGRFRDELRVFLKATGITLAGVLLVIGVGSSTQTMLGLKKAFGIKVALALPLLLTVWWFVQQDSGLRKKLKSPLTLGDLFLVCGGLAAAGVAVLIFLTRSGNHPVLVSAGGLEEKLRSFLETVLIARPRTKEFLIGHPLFLLALAWSKKERYFAVRLLLILGGLIGQISLINTFCHFHTPLWLSLLRSFNGLWLGCLVGWMLVSLYSLFRKRGYLG